MNILETGFLHSYCQYENETQFPKSSILPSISLSLSGSSSRISGQSADIKLKHIQNVCVYLLLSIFISPEICMQLN